METTNLTTAVGSQSLSKLTIGDLGVQTNKHETEEDRWRYNCEDCVRTREVGEVSTANIAKLGLESVDAFQQKFFWPALQAMQRGVAIDKKLRGEMALELQEEMSSREEYFRSVLGHPLNPKSPKQMQELFYNDLKCRPNWSKPKPGLGRTLTLDDKALEKISHEEPILLPLIRAIQEYRSLGVFLSTFVLAPLDVDGRMRTSYNICGTETYRFSSSENAFGSGTNLQNIPKGGDDDDSGLRLPNVRRLFVPDPGFTIFDTDLSKADLRIVAWESDEHELKAMLKEGRDPYVETAREFHHDPSIKKLRSDGSEDPRYKTFKSFAHGSHYLGTPHGLSQRLGLTVAAAERTQKWYFGKYPAIRRWQEEFKAQVASRRYVENIFGYRRYYFDRPDDAMFREAIAWLPQSTVALYINRIWMSIYERFPHIWILLQVHDSLVGQFPTFRKEESLRQLAEASQITLPYADPLIIPVGIKTSEKSWGDCE
jgi:DNA polymerase-1